jgi:hypothetical protein
MVRWRSLRCCEATPVLSQVKPIPWASAIQQQLSQINAKLDQVLTKLDDLDKKITAQHEQVMNALEALGFDIERTRDLLLNSLVHQAVS